MGSVHPKRVLQEARELEAKGELKSASLKYAFLIPILVRRERHLEAVELCEKVLQLSPTSTRMLLIQSLCFQELKRTKEAQAAVQKFAVAALRQKRVSSYLDLSRKRLAAHPSLLKAFLEKLLEIDRTRGDIFFSLAKVLARLGDLERALEIVFAGLRTKDCEEEGHAILKELLIERGRREDLEFYGKLLNKTLSLEVVQKKILSSSIGKMSAKSHDSSEESSQYSGTHSVLKSLDEDDLDTLKGLIQGLEEELGERPKGIETVSGLVQEFKEKAVGLLDGDSSALIDLAIAFKEMGLNSEAKETLCRIPPTAERYLEAQVILGDLELKLGSLVSALDVFQGVLRNQELSPPLKKESLYQVARIYLQLGDLKKSRDYTAKLTSLDSHYRDVMKLQQALAVKQGKK